MSAAQEDIIIKRAANQVRRPGFLAILREDIACVFQRDPAARTRFEVLTTYPGVHALLTYRIAHRLWRRKLRYTARFLSFIARMLTQIDIHPGATIGQRFVIDHGTGVVIGETTQIGKNIRVYQGVTLGALSLPKDAGERYRGKKRHPTIEDDVIIYAGATILGGDTVIGARSVIGGNVWLTESVPPDTTVIIEQPQLIYKRANTPAKGV